MLHTMKTKVMVMDRNRTDHSDFVVNGKRIKIVYLDSTVRIKVPLVRKSEGYSNRAAQLRIWLGSVGETGAFVVQS